MHGFLETRENVIFSNMACWNGCPAEGPFYRIEKKLQLHLIYVINFNQ